jgi:hypothetical protein
MQAKSSCAPSDEVPHDALDERESQQQSRAFLPFAQALGLEQLAMRLVLFPLDFLRRDSQRMHRVLLRANEQFPSALHAMKFLRT